MARLYVYRDNARAGRFSARTIRRAFARPMSPTGLNAGTRGRRIIPMIMPLLLGACAASPYDFPVPTMVGQDQGVSMTGYMATGQERVVRERLSKRMNCPAGVDFPVLDLTRADNKLGTKILYYRAVMKCRMSQGATPG